MKMKMKLTVLATSAILLSGCQTTGKQYPNFEPVAGSVHSFYPFQITGMADTPNQRLQVNSRSETSDKALMCLIGGIAVIVADSNVIMRSSDKKDWPEFGYVSNKIEEVMYDGSVTTKIYFVIEGGQRKYVNRVSNHWTHNSYYVEYNDEDKEGKMHGSFSFTGTSLFLDNMYDSFHASGGKEFKAK
ncbi:MAG: hypothetical protein ACRC0U_06275, partial [Vibrio sp.]